MSDLRFDGKVAIVTGSGGGLGKSVAMELARRGASVVINDISKGVDSNGVTRPKADIVVDEIKAFGGIATANYDSVEYGDKIVETAISAFGRIDVLINNAGILRDSSFHKMTDKQWDLVQNVHLRGSFKVTRAAWPHFRNQKFGRVLNITSSSGIYGNFGQANYSAAKLGLHGLTTTLAVEGESKNIKINSVSPMAGTQLTEGVFTPEMQSKFKPDYVVPFMVWVVHESFEGTGGLYESGYGWVGKLRWQRTKGQFFDVPFTAEQLRNKWDKVIDFTDAEYPVKNQESIMKCFENYQRIEELNGNKTSLEGIRSPEIFNLIYSYLIKEGAHAVKVCGATYNFEITKTRKGKVLKTWGIDLKNGNGQVTIKPFEKPDATFKMTDDDFFAVCMGKINPQIAFLQGKMKIRGNMKKATVFTPELFPKPTPENFAKYTSAKL